MAWKQQKSPLFAKPARSGITEPAHAAAFGNENFAVFHDGPQCELLPDEGFAGAFIRNVKPSTV